LAILVGWLSKWAPGITSQVDEGHEVADIVIGFMDRSRWNPETVRLKGYIKQGMSKLLRLYELMRVEPGEDSRVSG